MSVEQGEFKGKLFEFISDINALLDNPMLYSENLKGEYKLVSSQHEDVERLDLIFEQGGDSIVLGSNYRNVKSANGDLFYRVCYLRILRNIMCGVDVGFGDIIHPTTNEYVFYLSFQTLANEGLKKYREFKDSAKLCSNCQKLNKPTNKNCVFCKEQF
nr:hypothetical protein [uncultured Flavobacterium sp.]